MKYKIPKKGFEAWFYKKFPGSIKTKRAFLILIIMMMFSSSLVLLSEAGVINAKEDYNQEFANRISNIKFK